MPCMGFEPTIPASEREKAVHVLDRSATVTGIFTTIYCGVAPKGRNIERSLLTNGYASSSSFIGNDWTFLGNG
jgi:hypothetical protein